MEDHKDFIECHLFKYEDDFSIYVDNTLDRITIEIIPKYNVSTPQEFENSVKLMVSIFDSLMIRLNKIFKFEISTSEFEIKGISLNMDIKTISIVRPNSCLDDFVVNDIINNNNICQQYLFFDDIKNRGLFRIIHEYL